MAVGLRVWYRTGGTFNFTWKPVLELFPSLDKTVETRADLGRMGYPTIVLNYGDPQPTDFWPQV
jgi:hypothetical protein